MNATQQIPFLKRAIARTLKRIEEFEDLHETNLPPGQWCGCCLCDGDLTYDWWKRKLVRQREWLAILEQKVAETG